MEITVLPYTTARVMDPRSEAMTLPLTMQVVALPILTLVLFTAHRVGTGTEAPLPIHFWQALIILLQTK